MTYRVEIPAYTDRWMMGDRFGRVMKSSRVTNERLQVDRLILHVKLDVSQKTVKVIADDCRELD